MKVYFVEWKPTITWTHCSTGERDFDDFSSWSLNSNWFKCLRLAKRRKVTGETRNPDKPYRIVTREIDEDDEIDEIDEDI